MRAVALAIHRAFGLAAAGLLALVGATGCALAFYGELDRALNPSLLTVPIRDTPLADPIALVERALARDPRLAVDQIALAPEPGRAYAIWVYARTDPATGDPYALDFDQLFVDPYDGEPLGAREFGRASLARSQVMPFLYRLHYALALPGELERAGQLTLGALALAWTLDCILAVTLTFPRAKTGAAWLRAWARAWRITRRGRSFRRNYEIHLASGLWLWPALFVFAWSAVSFNLGEVYRPVTRVVLGLRESLELPTRADPIEAPALDWRAARATAERLARTHLAERQVALGRPRMLAYDAQTGLYTYWVEETSSPVRPLARVSFDATDGTLRASVSSRSERAGDVVTRWLGHLHTARVGGVPMQGIAFAAGAGTVGLSVTGVRLWLARRDARRRSRRDSATT